MRYIRRRHSGFSLIEIVLVAGLLMVLATVKFREMVDEADRLLGDLAGQHIQLIGDAANTYIGNNAAALSGAATTVITKSKRRKPLDSSTGRNARQHTKGCCVI